jgi:Flp pilus assembly protein TadD
MQYSLLSPLVAIAASFALSGCMGRDAQYNTAQPSAAHMQPQQQLAPNYYPQAQTPYGPQTQQYAANPYHAGRNMAAPQFTGTLPPGHSAPVPYGQQVPGNPGATSKAAEAANYWHKKLKQDPRNALFAINYSRNLRIMGQTKKAYEILKRAYMDNPEDLSLTAEYGYTALEMDKLQQAGELLEKAASRNADSWMLKSSLGILHSKIGNYAKAKQQYLQALELAPKSASVMNNLAVAYMLDNKPSEAETLLRKVAGQYPHDPQVRKNLGISLSLQGRIDEAEMVTGEKFPKALLSADDAYLRRVFKFPDRIKSSPPSDQNESKS